ncbi:capsular polysaccharide biosynthesis protein [Salirhabdus euzebyi]|uniref:Capsular polysaccharide biosynthesis protein n=1 Tax=Salirhabdus euzebyi TaxID=394506 RepID=A0A841Q4H1_9BACI|nr:Wzz/FepE/Etk N-terminal domain-containing protein [Salirhabdus euzebyi]MBB6453294.1 capsular polysaccharide biosynthesis protein [Salirhabdus euzebyi]
MSEESKELDLKFLFRILYKWKFFIMGVVVSSCLFAVLICYWFLTPIYETSAKLYVTTAEEAEDVDLDSIELSVQLMNTYKEMIKTTVVLEKVLEELPEYDLTVKELKENIEITIVSETPLMNIKVQDQSIQRAEQIVNQLLEVVKVEIPNISKFNHIVVLESPQERNFDIAPVFPNYFFIVIIMFILSFFITFGSLTFKEIMGDKIKTEDELKREYGLENLAIIPRCRKKDVMNSALKEEWGDKE